MKFQKARTFESMWTKIRQVLDNLWILIIDLIFYSSKKPFFETVVNSTFAGSTLLDWARFQENHCYLLENFNTRLGFKVRITVTKIRIILCNYCDRNEVEEFLFKGRVIKLLE